MTDTIASTLEVRKSNWNETRLVSTTLDLAPGANEVLLRVDRLALTANNISYASAGDSLGYWGFFPAQTGWGRIPAMGWGDVVASAHPEVQVGERVWGFFPFSTHLKILAGKAGAGQFHDVSAHRASYAPVYAQFDRASANPIYEPAREDQDSLLRGLFMTSWLVEDFLNQNSAFGAASCLISSASSKTGIALGQCVRRRGAIASIGITSPANIAFCESLGCYDKVLSYAKIGSLDATRPAVMVDMAGSAQLLSAVHHHLGDMLKYSCLVGATHHEEAGSVTGLPGATPEFFFAPGHIQARSRELGAGKLMMSLGTDYAGFRRFCDGWLRIERSFGSQAVERVYRQVLAGKADPACGQIISMWPALAATDE